MPDILEMNDRARRFALVLEDLLIDADLRYADLEPNEPAVRALVSKAKQMTETDFSDYQTYGDNHASMLLMWDRRLELIVAETLIIVKERLHRAEHSAITRNPS